MPVAKGSRRAGPGLGRDELATGEIEIRVQVALAEMEVRDISQDVLADVEHPCPPIEKVLVAAGRDIGSGVTTFRDWLRLVVLA